MNRDKQQCNRGPLSNTKYNNINRFHQISIQHIIITQNSIDSHKKLDKLYECSFYKNVHNIK